MTVYLIAQVEITDPAAYEAYRAAVPATILAHGGRFVVRAGRQEVLEGPPPPARIVIVAFDSAEAAHRWYDSPEYQAILPLRLRASRASLVLVEGV
jgi:uncharacterized protein (DUF1330 family)